MRPTGYSTNYNNKIKRIVSQLLFRLKSDKIFSFKTRPTPKNIRKHSFKVHHHNPVYVANFNAPKAHFRGRGGLWVGLRRLLHPSQSGSLQSGGWIRILPLTTTLFNDFRCPRIPTICSITSLQKYNSVQTIFPIQEEMT